MKKILTALLLFAASLGAGAAVQNDIIIGRVQANGFSTSNDYISTYKDGAMQFIMYDGAGLINTVRKLGPSITCGPVYCDAAASSVNWSSIMGTPTFASVAYTGDYNDLANKPTLTTGPAGPAGVNGTNGTNGTPGIVTLTTTGTGAATYNAGTATLNIPTPAGATPFNFSAPAAKTIAVSTAYQAADVSKAAIVTISPSCQNATTVLASSACTLQVRQSSAAGLTCSTGTITMTWTSTVQLGLVFTQSSGSPFDVKLPAGGYFITCATAGTFTLSAVEQTAG